MGISSLNSRVEYDSLSSRTTFNIMAAAVLEFETAITVQQLATILQCSRGQIYKLIDEKRLPALKVGTLVRLDPAQVADWIRSKMTIGVVN
jgi:excisionase family DNA binding protein